MAKYYVKSGELERIVEATTPIGAACLALERTNGETIDENYFYVDERGFRDGKNMTGSITTDEIPEFMLKHIQVFDTKGEG